MTILLASNLDLDMPPSLGRSRGHQNDGGLGSPYNWEDRSRDILIRTTVEEETRGVRTVRDFIRLDQKKLKEQRFFFEKGKPLMSFRFIQANMNAQRSTSS